MARLGKQGTFIALVLLIASAALADRPSPIRAFDLPTIERLGRAMYDQDRLAWQATDIAVAEKGKSWLADQKSHGWIVVFFADHAVVRFVHDGTNGPEAFYEVTFPNAGSPQGSIPASVVLSAEDLAQFRARRLAVANIKLVCSKSYNTIALRDPKGDGWLVWAMAATNDPALIVVGGHHRFTISDDGSKLAETDQLSQGCLNLDRRQQPANQEGMMINTILSPLPLETHVFASLSYGQAFYVGGSDGSTWKVNTGRITPTDMDSPGADGFSARVFAGQEEFCSGVVTNPSETPARFYLTTGVKVILPTENGDRFSPVVSDGRVLVAVVCSRMTVVPAPNDYKVLASGYDLSLGAKGTGMVTYEWKNGVLSYRLVAGTAVTPDLASRIEARLAKFRAVLK